MSFANLPIDGSIVLAAVIAMVLWVIAGNLLRGDHRTTARFLTGLVVAVAPAALLLPGVRAGLWRIATGLAGLQVRDAWTAVTYAVGLVVIVALAAAVLALVLCTAWLVQSATEALIRLYRKLFPVKVTEAERRAERRRALFDTAVPHLRSSTYVVSTSPLDPTGGLVLPPVMTPGRDGPVLRPPPPRRFTDQFDGGLHDFSPRSNP